MTKMGFDAEIAVIENKASLANTYYQDGAVISARAQLRSARERIATLLTLTASEERDAKRAVKKAERERAARQLPLRARGTGQ
jgi:hypothetical protein